MEIGPSKPLKSWHYQNFNKCTKLKQRELKNLKPGDWTCYKCSVYFNETDENLRYLNDIKNLYENIIVEDNNFEKYDKMLFNPLRYEKDL